MTGAVDRPLFFPIEGLSGGTSDAGEVRRECSGV
jgi:hypothetical protein